MAQWVKDMLSSLLWPGFDPWPGELLHATAVDKKKKKKKKVVDTVLSKKTANFDGH